MSFLVHWWPKWQQSSTLNRLLWYQVRYVFCVEPSKYRDISLPVWMLTSCKKNSGDKNKYFPISSWNSGIISIFIHYSLAVSGLLKNHTLKLGMLWLSDIKVKRDVSGLLDLLKNFSQVLMNLCEKSMYALLWMGNHVPIWDLSMNWIWDLYVNCICLAE